MSWFSEWVTVVVCNKHRDLHNVKMFRKGDVVALPDLPSRTNDVGVTVYKNKVRAWLSGGRLECLQLDPFEASPKWEKCTELLPIVREAKVIQVLDDVWIFTDRTIHVVPQTGNVSEIKWPHDRFHPAMCVQTNGISTIVIPIRSRHVYINRDATSPQSWEQLATLPSGLIFNVCLLMESSLYVTGGNDQGPLYKESYVIDIESGNVKRLGDLLSGKYDHAMMVINGAPAVISGFYRGTTEVLDVATGTWRAGAISFGQITDPAAVSLAIY